MSEQVVESTELDRYECRACGYVYEPEKGDDSHNIPPNTAFAELPITWRCPVCTAKKKAFENVGPAGTASGFSENLGYGLGVNKLTPRSKKYLDFWYFGSWFLVFSKSVWLKIKSYVCKAGHIIYR